MTTRSLELMGPVLLWGPPGVGKSTLGATLAHLLGWDHQDLDLALEAHHGAPPEVLWDLKGPSRFRDLEAELLAEWLTIYKRRKVVLSLGGGAALSAELRAELREL